MDLQFQKSIPQNQAENLKTKNGLRNQAASYV